MRKNIRLRVDQSFKTDDHEDITKYLEWLRSTINDTSQSLQRTTVSMILLIAVFELIYQSPKAQISLGSFRIYEGSIVLVFIPALVAYLYLEVLTATTHLSMIRVVFKNTFAKWNALAEENDLGLFVLTSMPLYWNIAAGAERPENAPKARKIVLPTTLLLVATVVYGPMIYEAQAYYRLYQLSALSIPLLISTCIAAFCILAGFGHYVVYSYSDNMRILANDVDFAKRYPRLAFLVDENVAEVEGDAVSGDPSD